MNKKQFIKYVRSLDLIRKKARIKGDRHKVKAITKLRASVIADFESKGRIGERPIKGRLMERSPKNCVNQACLSMNDKDSYRFRPFTPKR